MPTDDGRAGRPSQAGSTLRTVTETSAPPGSPSLALFPLLAYRRSWCLADDAADAAHCCVCRPLVPGGIAEALDLTSTASHWWGGWGGLDGPGGWRSQIGERLSVIHSQVRHMARPFSGRFLTQNRSVADHFGDRASRPCRPDDWTSWACRRSAPPHRGGAGARRQVTRRSPTSLLPRP